MAVRAARPGFQEREFHQWARSHLPSGLSGLLRLGDDTAAVRVGRNVALLTTDALVEGTHFLPASPPDAVGHAAAAASLSDIAAKGGVPLALLIDLLLPPDTTADWARRVSRSAEATMSEYDAHLVGGDTKPSTQRAVIGTILGVGDPRHLAPRSAASPGDLLLTTGSVGRGGLAALDLRKNPRPSRRTLRDLLAITPRVREGQALAPLAHAMLDTSDGIAEAAHLMAEASATRVILDPQLLPWEEGLDRQAPDPQRRQEVGFFGGDYELLAAIPEHRADAALRRVRGLGTPITVVGRVTRGRGARLIEGGAIRPLQRAGWDPFRRHLP